MENQDYSVGIVIPTRNRRKDIDECLQSINQQTFTPRYVVIVDSSDNNETELLAREYRSSLHDGIIYKKSPIASLTYQRNLGISELIDRIDIILFLDDDIILAADYISFVVDIFKSDNKERIGGSSGVSKDTFDISNASKLFLLFRKYFLFESQLDGVVLSSGVNIPVRTKSSIPVRTEWLFGCGAYRSHIFKEFQFDEWYNGYGLFEDVDFSYRVGKIYDLYVDSRAELIHKRSSSSRPSEKKMGNLYVTNRFYFLRKNFHINIFSFSFWWNNIGYIIINIYFWLKNNDTMYLERLKGSIIACLDILSGKSRAINRNKA